MRVKKAKRRPGPSPFYPGEPKNAAPNGGRIRAEQRNEKEEFRDRRIPPSSVLDKIAEEKITGRFKTAKSNISKCCFVTRASNGACGSCGRKGK